MANELEQKNKQYGQNEGLNKQVWPTDQKLANQVKGTKSVVVAKAAGTHNVFQANGQKNGVIHSRVASSSLKESSKGKIF